MDYYTYYTYSPIQNNLSVIKTNNNKNSVIFSNKIEPFVDSYLYQEYVNIYKYVLFSDTDMELIDWGLPTTLAEYSPISDTSDPRYFTLEIDSSYYNPEIHAITPVIKVNNNIIFAPIKYFYGKLTPLILTVQKIENSAMLYLYSSYSYEPNANVPVTYTFTLNGNVYNNGNSQDVIIDKTIYSGLNTFVITVTKNGIQKSYSAIFYGNANAAIELTTSFHDAYYASISRRIYYLESNASRTNNTTLEFFVDNISVGTQSGDWPFIYFFNTNYYSIGSHEIYVKATNGLLNETSEVYNFEGTRPSDATLISYGQTLNGTIAVSSPVSRWRAPMRSRGILYYFYAESGDHITISQESSTLDTHLILADVNMYELAWDGDSGSGFNALLNYTINYDGLYFISAETYTESYGDFTITLTKS